MRTINKLIMGLVITACAAFGSAELLSTSFVSGLRQFRGSDDVTIKEVLSTSSSFGIGDEVVVRGNYRLGSEEVATLGLFVTYEGVSAHERFDPKRVVTVKKGSGVFELTTRMEGEGVLHVTIYGISDRRPVGGVYFGSAAQMAAVKDWVLSDYKK